MQEYDDIEQFSGGGRISPQESATYYPEGSLRSGNNGNLWINQKDINGRLSWKVTAITKEKYPKIKYNEYEEQISIWLTDTLKIFYYYFDTPKLFFTYPDGEVLRISDRLNNLTEELANQFDVTSYNLQKNENDLSYGQILRKVDALTTDLIYLQNHKKLRKPNGIPETPSEPETKDFTSEQLEMFKDWIYTSKPIFLNMNTNDYYFVDDFDEKYKALVVKGFLDQMTYPFSAEEYNREFHLKFKRLDYNPNASKKLKMITVVYSENADLDTSVYVTWKAFQDKLKTLKITSDGYDKTKVFILWENNKAILDRIDIGQSEGDFNPNTKFVGDFLSSQTSAMFWSNFIDRRIEAFFIDTVEVPETPKPDTIFEVGDKVKLPSTKLSKKLRMYMSVVWDKANENGQDYLVVNEIAGKKIVLNTYLSSYEDPDGDYFNITLDKIELYEDRLEETEVKTDGTKITSKRTKEFYDNNKSKLDKIDSKISNKFIEALAFLSQYEESGEVIYTKQNKTTANDLISRIQNLKKN